MKGLRAIVIGLCFLTKAMAIDISPVKPLYPPLARAAGVEGKVKIEVSFDDKGSISETTVLSGSMLLAAAAKRNVASWKFSNVNGEKKVVITFNYRLDQRAQGTEVSFSNQGKTVTIITSRPPLQTERFEKKA